MNDRIRQAIEESREREKKAKAAGCLPADSCVFDGATGRCVFCERLAGQLVNPYEEKWAAKDEAISDLPRFREALSLAVDYFHGRLPEQNSFDILARIEALFEEKAR